MVAGKRYCVIVEAINRHGAVSARRSSNGVRVCGAPTAGTVIEALPQLWTDMTHWGMLWSDTVLHFIAGHKIFASRPFVSLLGFKASPPRPFISLQGIRPGSNSSSFHFNEGMLGGDTHAVPSRC